MDELPHGNDAVPAEPAASQPDDPRIALGTTRPPGGDIPTRRAAAYVIAAATLVVVMLAVAATRNHSFGGSPASLVRAANANKQLRAQEAQREADQARRQAAYEACAGGVDPLLNSLNQLDTDLDVGLNYSDYSDEVRQANRDYQTVVAAGLSSSCLRQVGVPLENALNDYINADNTWNNCVSDIYCSNESIKSTLQAKWAKASVAIQRAQTALNLMKVAVAPLSGGSSV